MKNRKADISLNIIIIAAIALLVLVILSVIFIGKMPESSRIEYHDEVIYDCGSHLVRGTEINKANWDLENGVDEYYLYDDNYSIEHKIPLHVWIEEFNSVDLKKGEDGCKEILRFNAYTKVEINETRVGINE